MFQGDEKDPALQTARICALRADAASTHRGADKGVSISRPSPFGSSDS